MGGILVDFERKLKNQQYISVAVFNRVKKRAPEQFLKQFSLNRYNEEILESEYAVAKSYFDSIFAEVNPKLNLTKEQAKAIMADEKCKLIIAGADDDKTNTVIASVKYLTDKKHIAPNEILIIANTERDMTILRESIGDCIGLPVDIASFRSIGYRYIRRVLRYKNCYAVSEDERARIFLKYLKKRILTSYENIEDFLASFDDGLIGRKNLIGSFFRKNYGRFVGFDDYFDGYVKNKVSEAANIETRLKRHISDNLNGGIPSTMIGEQVRNKGEAIVANWLFRHSISYKYAQPFDDLLPPDANSFRPDFTVDIGGRKIYIEYFCTGIDDAKAKEIKREFHRRHHTNLIMLDYEPNYGYLKTLQEKLECLGMQLPRERGAKDSYAAIIRHNPLVEFEGIQELFYKTIDTIKISPDRRAFNHKIEDCLNEIDDLDARVRAEKQYKYIRDFYSFYNSEIHRDADRLGFDAADMLYYAGVYIDRDENLLLHYKYIIVEEDASGLTSCHKLTRSLLSCSKASATIVGNDWRTIYANAGLRMRNIYHFRDSLKNTRVFPLASSPRCDHCSPMNMAGDYILRNYNEMRDRCTESDPFVFLNYSENEPAQIRDAILSLQRQRPNDKILVLTSTNAEIKKLFESNAGFQKESATKTSLKRVPNYSFDMTTATKAKNTLADWVIVAGLNCAQPNMLHESTFWLMKLFLDELEDDHPFEAERKAICAALMRARYKVILPRHAAPEKQDTLVDGLYAALRK